MNTETPECQPCNEYKPKPDYYDELYNVHQCIVCLKGTVKFCTNCFYDHHNEGYESCVPTGACMRNHPVCVKRWNAYSTQIAGIPIGEFL